MSVDPRQLNLKRMRTLLGIAAFKLKALKLVTLSDNLFYLQKQLKGVNDIVFNDLESFMTQFNIETRNKNIIIYITQKMESNASNQCIVTELLDKLQSKELLDTYNQFDLHLVEELLELECVCQQLPQNKFTENERIQIAIYKSKYDK